MLTRPGQTLAWDAENRLSSVVANGVTATYYYAGSTRIAMRTAAGVTWLAGDHLGSASLATNAAGQKVSEERYYPYGATRSGAAPTDYQFTGQQLDSGTGLPAARTGRTTMGPGIMTT